MLNRVKKKAKKKAEEGKNCRDTFLCLLFDFLCITGFMSDVVRYVGSGLYGNMEGRPARWWVKFFSPPRETSFSRKHPTCGKTAKLFAS